MFTEKNNERYMFKVWSIREQQMYPMEDIERILYEEGKVVGVYATGERLIPRPMSNEDAKLVARMIRNYNKLQRVQYNYIDESDGVDTRQTREAMAYAFWTPLGYKQENFQTMHYNEELADFFDTCDGLMSEEEWFKLHKDECDDDE